jgi:hypothetical protein
VKEVKTLERLEISLGLGISFDGVSTDLAEVEGKLANKVRALAFFPDRLGGSLRQVLCQFDDGII